ncbi:hypothetical protein K9L05_02390 [Candidatus Babeliales bacterium]|nr:hypothetical protein [Candidatus Babeliales bacterium]MCF7899475.1 hypothetical protein [Candidatus Babeliales bacterium]
MLKFGTIFLFILCLFINSVTPSNSLVSQNSLVIRVNTKEAAHITLAKNIIIFTNSSSYLNSKLNNLLNSSDEDFKLNFFEQLKSNLLIKYNNCENLKIDGNFYISLRDIENIIKDVLENIELSEAAQGIAQNYNIE